MFDWLRRRRDRPVELSSGALEFLGPQGGAAEFEFQRLLTKLLASHPSVRRAYLARVRYEPGGPEHVALCLTGELSEAVLDEVQKVFWAQFSTDQHMDILFVTPDEEQRLALAGEPFYAAPPR